MKRDEWSLLDSLVSGINMRKIILSVLAAGCILFPAYSLPQPEGKVLVLGTESKEITDVQDRILRESVMRGILSSGMSIVSVMDIERTIQLDGIDIRKVPSSTVPALTERLGGRFSVRGSYGGRENGYRYTLVVEDIIAGKRYSTDITVMKEEPFQVYCPGLVKRIVLKVSEIARSAK